MKKKTTKNMSIQRKDANKLGPVEYALQCQRNTREIILGKKIITSNVK